MKRFPKEKINLIPVPMPHRTLATVLLALDVNPNLSDSRRRDLKSAVQSTARLLDKAPELISADWASLRRQLDKTHAGMSVKRRQNIKSDLRAALKETGGLSASPRSARSPVWQAFFDKLKTKRVKNGLTGFIRYCSEREILPEAVTDIIVTDYYQHLELEGARPKPKEVYRRTCRIWNEVRPLFGDLELQTLTLPNHRRPPWTVPWDALSFSFRSDVESHLFWLSGKDLLSDPPPPNVLKPSTLKLRKNQIHGLVSAAIEGGANLDSIQSLRDLVAPDVAKMALNHYLERHDNRTTGYIQDLAGTIVSIAKHWCQVDQGSLDRLTQYRRRLKSETTLGLTQKNRDTLRQFEVPENLEKLLHLPSRLMRTATRLKSSKRQAVQVQMALAIEILLHMPMRISNLAGLRLDQHIQRLGGKRGPVYILLASAETKNDLEQEYELSPDTVKLLDRYLDDYRPTLIEGDNPWLFPGTADAHKQAKTLSDQIQNVIRRETGLKLTPHQFRHLSAQIYLEAHPGDYETPRQHLGHKNLKTTVNFYAGAEARAAHRRSDAVLEARRNQRLPKSRRKRS